MHWNRVIFQWDFKSCKMCVALCSFTILHNSLLYVKYKIMMNEHFDVVQSAKKKKMISRTFLCVLAGVCNCDFLEENMRRNSTE